MNNSCCFTGHRIIPAEKLEKMIANLDMAIDGLIEKGVKNFLSGGALGFDTIAASLIIAKRKSGKDIRLILALPCKNQDKFWNARQKQVYKSLLEAADEIVYVSEKYDDSCMRRRNEYLVNSSAYCVCALIKENSGTGQTAAFARKKGLHIINVL